MLRGTIKGQAGAMPTLPSDPRSRIQPDTAPGIYCHRYHGAAAWDLLPGVCVSTARERGGPPCGRRGSDWSGPAPAPWLSTSSALSDPQASHLRPLHLLRTPVSPFRVPLPPPSEPRFSLQSPLPPPKPLLGSDSSACDPTIFALEFPPSYLSGPHCLFCWTRLSF